jgi:hypothetical protein
MHDFPDLSRLPLVPETILRQHRVHEPNDTRFRACARLLQALWREDKGLPIGTHVSPDGRRRKLGSRITAAAGHAGSNFLSSGVAYLARREVAYREIGALIDEQRLWTNLLSSMPLTFNLLGPLRLDLSLATRVLRRLCPDLQDASVRCVWFEHSPGRGVASLTGDGTAFDALIGYERSTGQTGFVAVEVKYTEAGHEPGPDIRPRYDEIASASGLFLEPASRMLRTNPLQQLFREHCLAQAMVTRGDYDEGRLLVIAPKLNHLMTNTVRAYQGQLRPVASADQVLFQAVTLETVIEAIGVAGEEAYAHALYRRYCDFWLVDGEIELALAALPHPAGDDTAGGRGLKLIAGGQS